MQTVIDEMLNQIPRTSPAYYHPAQSRQQPLIAIVNKPRSLSDFLSTNANSLADLISLERELAVERHC